MAKVKLVFYALLMCTINFSAVYYAFFHDGDSMLFADKGEFAFGEHTSIPDKMIPVIVHIKGRNQDPIENVEVTLKSMSDGNASSPQKTNANGMVRWTASQGVYTVVIYLNQQVIKKRVVVIDHKHQPVVKLNLDI